ncbi:MAG: ceramidase domain-containing protein [Neisseriaceae bacterium]
MKKPRNKQILLLVTLITIVIVLLSPRVAQPLSYHIFADNRTLFGIKNFMNVISNIAFIVAGGYGLMLVFSKTNEHSISKDRSMPYLIFFLSSVLVGFGSGYYHLNPDNLSFFWDRLPMSIMLMSIFCAIFADRVNQKIGYYLVLPLGLIGLISVIYWECSELIGRGDLRFYFWAQAYPFIMVILVMLLYPPKHSHTYLIIAAIVSYGIAKVCEFLDKGIYTITFHLISGHTLKHLFAALSVLFIAKHLSKRKFKLNNTIRDNSLLKNFLDS